MPGSLEPLDLSVQIPYHFRCPISLELMRDPVTVSTGQTYDRCSIESWVATGNTTCPVTRAPLSDFTLIPNHTLRRLIQDWCVSNRSLGIERIPTPKQPAEPSLVRSLLNQVASESDPDQSRLSAIRRLRGLARDSEKNRSIFSSHNVREILINVIFGNDSDSNSSDLNHEALALLVMFPLGELECVSIASDSERINYLVNLLFHSSIEVRVNSAALIEIVVAGTKSADLRAQISDVDDIFEGVIEMLKNPILYRALKTGIKALFALCLVKQTRHKAVSAGAAEALIDRLADFDKCDAERALATIELLCRVPVGCAAFAKHALTVPLLVKTKLKISYRAAEYAAGALLALCTASEQSQREAVSAGILRQLMLLVQSGCTDRAKRKAQMLLKLLRDSWPEDSSGNSDDFVFSEVVPF